MQIDATGKISKEQLLSAIQQAVQYDPLENDNEQIRITEVSFNDVRGGFLDYMGAPIKIIDKVVGYTALMITGEATVTARVYYKIEDIAPADPSNPPDQSYFIGGVAHDDFTFRSVSNDCTVTFDGNGATSGSMSAFKVVKGQDATLSENQFELEHHPLCAMERERIHHHVRERGWHGTEERKGRLW